MDFSAEKELVKEFKIKAIIEKLTIDAIEKEMQNDNYTDEELEVFNKLLGEANENYNKYQESYTKGSVLFEVAGLKEITNRLIKEPF